MMGEKPTPDQTPQLNLRLELWAKTVAQTQYALGCGALKPIATESNLIEQNGIYFLVRVLANLVHKQAAQVKQQVAQTGKDFNPFLPYDRDLFVADLSETHLCLLNKYNVVDHHLLIITREFEDQETPLTPADFEALWLCLADLALTKIDSLAFYNSGKVAGASQRHKHLQLVPLPLIPDGDKIPIEVALATVEWSNGIGKSPVLPFEHAVMRLQQADLFKQTTSQRAQVTLEAYYQLLSALGLWDAATGHLTGAYNLLVTRQWLMIVPRSQEQFAEIPVNSLGFAGTLFVRSAAQLEQLRAISPLKLLQEVGVSTVSR